MSKSKKIVLTLFFTIYFLHVLAVVIPIQEEGFLNSNEFTAGFLRGFGLSGEKRGDRIVPRLSRSSNGEATRASSGVHFKPSSYFIPGWADTRFGSRKNITINAAKVSADLTNFPVLIDLYDPDLQNNAQASGNDIFFTDSTGYTLYHEIELYDRVYNSTHAHLVAWVRTNLTASQNTLISMYYDNPTAVNRVNPKSVWDDQYVGVWHLKEDPSASSPQIKDSTSYGNDGVAQGGLNTSGQISAKMDGGMDFWGSQNINLGNDQSLDITQELTVDLWVNLDIDASTGSWPPIIGKGDGDSFNGWMLFQLEQSHTLKFVYKNSTSPNWILSTGEPSTLQLDTWHHIVVTFSVSQGVARLYIDGSVFDTSFNIAEILSSSDSLFFSKNTFSFDGSLDEVRISKVARSADWITTQYNNQYDPSSFYSLGIEQNRPTFKSWPFPSMRYRKNVTIDSGRISSDLTNFPFLLNLSDSDLHDKQEVQIDGGDILFADSSGVQLDHEIEFFDKNYNTSHAQLVVWIRVPFLSSSTDTVISMYFGNPTIENQENPAGVWDASYLSVWHFDEEGNGSRYDSTSNNNDGTPFNYEGDEAVLGKIGGSDKLDGIDDYIEVNKSGSIKGLSQVTFEGWINIGDLSGSSQNIYIETIQNTIDTRFIVHISTSNSLRFAGRAPDSDSVTLWGFVATISTSTWYHIVAIFDSLNDIQYLYLNGVEYSTALSEPSIDNGDPLKPPSIGGLEGADLFNGTIDEFRVSATARNLDWITTEYDNQNNPTTFYTVGPLKTPSPVGNWAFPWLSYKKDLTINSNAISGTLDNFPLLVRLDDTDLASSSIVQDDGDDIAFADDLGNRLDHEIEFFDKTHNSSYARLVAWVRIPYLSNITETTISMYYGSLLTGPQENPAGVWDSNFKGIWHLNEISSIGPPQIRDSTDYSNDGYTYGSMNVGSQMEGQIDGSLKFDGVNDFINCTNSTSLNMGSGDFTFAMWFKSSTSGATTRLGGKGATAFGGKRYSLELRDTGSVKGEIDDDFTKVEVTSSGTNYNDGNWHYVVLVRDGNNLRLYLDGTEDPNSPADITGIGGLDDSNAFYIGTQYDNVILDVFQFFNGSIDEVSISNTSRSADWILSRWTNHVSSDSFYIVRNLEKNPFIDDWAYPWLQYRKYIQVDSTKISGRMYDFPLLINISDVDLHDSNKVQIDGSDIAFGDTNGMRIPHEIEYFSQAGNGTHAYLVAWAKVPLLSMSTANYILMYYGNTAVYNQENGTGVWNSNYAGVWHLGDDPSPYYIDSTANNNHGVALNSPLNDTSSKIDGGVSFDDSNDRGINISHSSSLAISTNIMVSTWIKTTDSDADVGVVVNKWGNPIGERNYWLGKLNAQVFAFYVDDNYSVQYDLSRFNDGEWHYIVCTAADNGILIMYLDGIPVNSTSWDGISTTGTNDLHIGKPVETTFQEFNGDVDEVRISKIVRSREWVRTEYINQLDPSSFYTLGTEEESLQWWDASYSMRMDIGIDNSKVSGNLFEFPLLVNITDSNLKSGNIQADASDLLFTEWKGNKLNHEVEFFSQDSIEGHLIAWVQLPTLSNSQYNLISMYFNNPDLPDQANPTGVWDTYFKGVWHLSEDPSISQMKDSTFYNNDGTTSNLASDDQESGQIDGSLDFDNVNDQVNFGDKSSLNMGSGDFSLSLWFNYDGVDKGPLAGKGSYGSNGIRYYIAVDTTAGLIKGEIDDNGGSGKKNITSTSTYADNLWHHAVLVRDGANLRFYIDGSEISSSPVDITGYGSLDLALPFYMNTLASDTGGTLSDWSSSKLDEVRVSNLARSGNWISASYSNQRNASSFYVISSVLSYDLSPPVINDFGVDDLGIGTGIFWADVSDEGSNIVTVDVRINGSDFSMSFNGTHWIYQQLVILGALYEIQIFNASDSKGNYLFAPSNLKQIYFTNDFIAPTVDDWDYFDNIGPYGTFRANVSDSWGTIDTVLVNVTMLNSVPRNDLWAVMVSNGTSYVNDTISMPKGSVFWYVVTVNDTAGNPVTTSPVPAVIPDINHAPEAQNLALSRDNSLILLPILSNSTLYLHYDFYDADNDSEGGTEIRWYKNGVLQSPYNDLKQISNTSALIKGDVWNATVRPKDGQDFGNLEIAANITIQNTPPVVQSVIIPTSISIDNLTLSNVTIDEDSDSILFYETKWYRNSTYLSNFDNLILITFNNTKKGETWFCEIRAYDGTNYSQWVSSNTITIDNTPPSASDLVLSPLNPNTSSLLTASWTFADADNDSESNYYIQWYRWDTLQSVYDNLINLPSTATAKNQEWYFKLIVNDGEGNSTTYSSPKVIIQNTPPAASNLIITVDPFTSTPLSSSWTFNDADGDSQPSNSWIIFWYKNNILQSQYDNLTTIPASGTTKGEVWNYTLKVFDGTNYSIQYNSSISIIKNSIPIASGLTITLSPTTTENITAGWNYDDDDNDPQNTNWIIYWYKDNSLMTSYTNQTEVPASATIKGEVWNYTLKVFDGEAYSITYNSSISLIVNTAPSVINPTFNKTSGVTTGDSINVTYGYFDPDNDLEVTTERVVYWYQNSIYRVDKENQTILYDSETTSGEYWQYQIRVYDGVEWSQNFTSTLVVIGNAPNNIPEIQNITFTGNENTTLDDLILSYDYFDLDGHLQSNREIFWFKNGVIQAALNGSTIIDSSLTKKGEIWNCTIRVYDGLNWSLLYNANQITIQNAMPTTTDISNTIDPTTDQDLIAGWTYFDADNDPQNSSWIVRWYKNGQLQTLLNDSAIIKSGNTTRGETWNFTLRVFDGTDYSIQYNSSLIQIFNSPPSIASPSFNKTVGVTSDHSIEISYSFNDIDGDSEDVSYRIVYWYKDTIYQALKLNHSILFWQDTVEGEVWYYMVRVFDGTAYSVNFTSTPVSIGASTNDPPIAENLSLTLNPTTLDNLIAFYDYFDNQSHPEAGSLIRWYQNGQLQSHLNDTKLIPSSETSKGDIWYFTLRPKDGRDYGLLVTSFNVTILNSKPTASSLSLNPSPSTIDDLTATWLYNDADNDIEDNNWIIGWYRNNQLQAAYNNLKTIPSMITSKGDSWRFTLRVFDGENYSIQYNSSSMIILNTIPIITEYSYGFDPNNSHVDPDIRTSLTNQIFFIDDEDLSIYYKFEDPDFPIDQDKSLIQWYYQLESGTWIEILAYQNSTSIPHSETYPGDRWKCVITPFDGTDIGTGTALPELVVESRPKIIDFIITPLVEDQEGSYYYDEGMYNLTIVATNLIPIDGIAITLNDSLGVLYHASKAANNDSVWMLIYQLPKEDFTTKYLETKLSVEIKASSVVTYNSRDFSIYALYMDSFVVEDRSPPRVEGMPRFEFNDELNPTNITFYTDIVDYGSEIAEVVLYYYFQEFNSSGGTGSAIGQNWRSTKMSKVGENGDIIKYAVTVRFDHNQTSREIIYYIETMDSLGNRGIAYNINNDPERIDETRFTYSPPGIDPTFVLIIIGITIISAIFGSIVYVKFIRKPEIVGLDKELVLGSCSDVDETEIRNSWDEHTVGIVVSFFDQRHGPIPIIVEPAILNDNFRKLVDLSDRSFSSTGFCDEFSREISSSYDFVLSHGARIKSMTFGFALNRPNSRGKQEDLTLNVLIHQELFPLVNQFLDEIQAKVHILHIKMDENPEDKDEIRRMIIHVRKYVSQIVLSYEKIYGTTELIKEE
ncbi:MAG: DUF2341 domain-containing protein [Candidatus Thorarchaeota archaeon]